MAQMAQLCACRHIGPSQWQGQMDCKLTGKHVDCLGFLSRCCCPETRHRHDADEVPVPRSERVAVWEG